MKSGVGTSGVSLRYHKRDEYLGGRRRPLHFGLALVSELDRLSHVLLQSQMILSALGACSYRCWRDQVWGAWLTCHLLTFSH